MPCNIIIADYTQLDDTNIGNDLKALLEIDRRQRNIIERRISCQIADKIFHNLPHNDGQTETLLQQGSELARRMSWDVICQKYFLPALDRAYHKYRARQIA